MSRKASLKKRPTFWRCRSWPRGRGEYLLVLTLDDPNQRVFRNLARFAPRTTRPIDRRPCSPVPASCKAWTSAEGPWGHKPQLKRVLGVPGSNPSRTWPCTQSSTHLEVVKPRQYYLVPFPTFIGMMIIRPRSVKGLHTQSRWKQS